MLFTLYGAVLEYSGAARFLVQLSYAAFGRSRAGPERTTTLAGFLLGTVSGSGVATTVTLGSVTWPLLRKAGYPKEAGGGVLAASGIGAILSPPTLGAAAFIIAEFLAFLMSFLDRRDWMGPREIWGALVAPAACCRSRRRPRRRGSSWPSSRSPASGSSCRA